MTRAETSPFRSSPPAPLDRVCRRVHEISTLPSIALKVVEVANLICTLKGLTPVGRKLVRFSPSALSRLNLTKEDLSILAEDLDAAVFANAGLFNI